MLTKEELRIWENVALIKKNKKKLKRENKFYIRLINGQIIKTLEKALLKYNRF